MRVLIEFENKPKLFDKPRREIVCAAPQGLTAAFKEISRAVSEGFWVAGFASYEAGLALEPALGVPQAPSFPFLHFGVFNAPRPSVLPAGGAFTVRDRGVSPVSAMVRTLPASMSRSARAMSIRSRTALRSISRSAVLRRVFIRL